MKRTILFFAIALAIVASGPSSETAGEGAAVSAIGGPPCY